MESPNGRHNFQSQEKDKIMENEPIKDEKTFREKLGSDIKTIKKLQMKEEFKSFLAALGFAANAVVLAFLPFTFLSVFNILAAWYCMKQFKPTVKKQIMYANHLKFLSTIKEEKVWTQSDK